MPSARFPGSRDAHGGDGRDGQHRRGVDQETPVFAGLAGRQRAELQHAEHGGCGQQQGCCRARVAGNRGERCHEVIPPEREQRQDEENSDGSHHRRCGFGQQIGRVPQSVKPSADSVHRGRIPDVAEQHVAAGEPVDGDVGIGDQVDGGADEHGSDEQHQRAPAEVFAAEQDHDEQDHEDGQGGQDGSEGQAAQGSGGEGVAGAAGLDVLCGGDHSEQHDDRCRQMRLGLVGHIDHDGQENEASGGEGRCPVGGGALACRRAAARCLRVGGGRRCSGRRGDPPCEPVDGRDADEAPAGRPGPGHDVEVAECLGVIQVVHQVAREVSQAEFAGQGEEGSNRIDPEAAILVEPRVEVAPGGFHPGERHQGDHFVGLSGVEAVADEDAGTVLIGAVKEHRLGRSHDGCGVDVGAARAFFGPVAGEVVDLAAGPDFVVAEEVSVHGA